MTSWDVIDPRIGTELGGYRLEARIGEGGMGVVYRAEQAELKRKVALKLLAPERAKSPGFRERFERESLLAAAIDHPHILPIYGTGKAGDDIFIVMRYVDGTDLSELLGRAAPLPVRRALHIAGQVASALDAAHARGLVHRDVKPANVLVDSKTSPEHPDHCYLTDFGLTKDVSQDGGMTASGHFVGTIPYVAPEQINGDRQGPATDQYALGCVLFECLTGRPPFERKREVEVIQAHLLDEPPRLSDLRPDCPAALSDVLAKSLAKDPSQRHASCGAMIAAARFALAPNTVVSPTVASPEPPVNVTRPSERGREPSEQAGDAPSERSPPRSRRGWLGFAVGSAVLVFAAVVGGVIAGRGGHDDPAPAANVASAGGMSLRFPTDWEPLALPPAIPGLKFEDRVALGPRAAAGREGLIAGPVAASDTRLLPRELLSGEGADSPKPTRVRLGEAEAFRFAGLRPKGFAGAVTAYVVLTERGRRVIACYAATRSRGFDAPCAAVASSLALNGVRAHELAPSASYAAAVSKVLAFAAHKRATGRRRLREARTSVGQSAALDGVAKGYATAARRARRLAPPAAAADVDAAIAAALRRLGTAFTSAAAAARQRDLRRYRAARRATDRLDRTLRQAVLALAERGYATT